MYFASLRYTSPTFLASIINTIASVTFVIAIVLRLEVLNLRNRRGLAKVLGTLVSLAGVMTMTLYKGPIVRNLWHPLIHVEGKSSIHENWLKGSILTVASCITWSIWYIVQAITLKRYPAQLSLTTWMSFIGAAQSAVFTVCIEHRRAAWTIGFNIDLWSILYAGVVCSGLIIFIQLWCTEEKGPVFVTMFNPISTILVAVLAYFVLGERLYTGSILGAFIVILGLYLLLWGKEGDEVYIKSEESSYQTTYEEHKDNKIQKITSAKKDVLHELKLEKDERDQPVEVMAQEACSNLGGVYRNFKPHILMVLAQVAFAFLHFLTEASFNHGMNPHVYITYRHIVSGLVMFPFAYVLERKQRPKLTIALFLNFLFFLFLGWV
ncbi:unnamed protein product [Prunus brigantina]